MRIILLRLKHILTKMHVQPEVYIFHLHFAVDIILGDRCDRKTSKTTTGKLRYLGFQGNGESTSSFPKFEIANYDVTRIHVHEQKCVHFCLNTLTSFRKIGIATKRLYVCNPLYTTRTFFTLKYWGQIMGGLVQQTKLLDHFLNGILARKRHFRAAFSAH